MEKITQSLAGRVGILTLLPFSMEELPAGLSEDMSLEKWTWQGEYPVIYDRKAPPELVFTNYVETYLQRDVRQMRQVGDLNQFDRFLRLCAGRAGHLLNLSTLANDADISVNTAKAWLSILEASYVLFFYSPILFSGLSSWQKISGLPPEQSFVVYGGEQRFQTENGLLLPWKLAISEELP